MRFVSILCLIVSTLALAGCNKTIDIKNGELPSGWVSYAEKFVGKYAGSFDGVKKELTISLVGNKLLLSSNEDLVDPRCGSAIGDLQSLRVTHSKKHPETDSIIRATFAFDPKGCPLIQGSEVTLSFKEGSPIRFDIRLLERTVYTQDCSLNPGPNGGVYQSCHTDTYFVYLDGRFTMI